MVSQKAHLSRSERDCAPCPAYGGRAFYETIGLQAFYEFIKIETVRGETGDLLEKIYGEGRRQLADDLQGRIKGVVNILEQPE